MSTEPVTITVRVGEVVHAGYVPKPDLEAVEAEARAAAEAAGVEWGERTSLVSEN